LRKMHQTLAEHRTLTTRYYSAIRDSEDTRVIEPCRLIFHSGDLSAKRKEPAA